MTRKEVRQRLVLAPVHRLPAPRAGKPLRSQDALKAEQGLGIKEESY